MPMPLPSESSHHILVSDIKNYLYCIFIIYSKVRKTTRKKGEGEFSMFDVSCIIKSQSYEIFFNGTYSTQENLKFVNSLINFANYQINVNWEYVSIWVFAFSAWSIVSTMYLWSYNFSYQMLFATYPWSEGCAMSI